MVNDLEKLNKVIGSLEEQASRVSEFNGILQSINEARTEIESIKAVLNSLTNEQRQLIADSYSKFNEFDKRLYDLERKLSGLEQIQENVLQKIVDLKFLTPEQYEQGRRASDTSLNESVSFLTEKMEEGNQKHHDSFKSFKIFTVSGLLVLAGTIAFLASSLLY